MKPQKAREIRIQLIRLLESLLVGVELAEPSDSVHELEQLLNVALAGLEDLNAGETPPVFKPLANKRRGKWPAQMKRVQLSALRHEASLRRRGMTLDKARGAIATEFGVSVETIRSWLKQLNLESKAEVAQAIRQDAHLEKSSKKLFGWKMSSCSGILKQARRDGDARRLLMPPKSAKAG